MRAWRNEARARRVAPMRIMGSEATNRERDMNSKGVIGGHCALTAALTVQSASATAGLQITEVYFGLSGDDGTPDWFEITNYGDATGDTGTLYYDDESADPTVNGQLDSILLAPGASAVFLIEAGTGDIDTFASIWGSGID